MIPQRQIYNVFLYSFFITLAIFFLGIIANYGLDFVRINALSTVIADHELSTDLFLTEQFFLETFGGNVCEDANYQIQKLRDELQQVGIDLSTYTTNSWFNKKDFDFLKRKYFLLELRMITFVAHMNTLCDEYYIPIIFFYEIDDTVSERQGFVLDEISLDYQGQVIVLSFDKDYTDEPLIPILRDTYQVISAPTIIINNQYKEEGIQYVGQINATIHKIVRTPDPYAPSYDLFVTSNTTFLPPNSPLALSEYHFAKARIEKNASLICESLSYYDNITNISPLQQALVYETFSSVGCGRNKKAFYTEAEKIWTQLNFTTRAKLAYTLSTRKTEIAFPLAFNVTNITASFVLPEERLNNTWYGLTNDGILSFIIPPEQVYVPSTRFLRKDIALLVNLE